MLIAVSGPRNELGRHHVGDGVGQGFNPFACQWIRPARSLHLVEKSCSEMSQFSEIHTYLNANLEKIKSRLWKILKNGQEGPQISTDFSLYQSQEAINSCKIKML